jgi:hypothetical protein
MNRYELLWEKALEGEDIKSAISVLKQMLDALGLTKEKDKEVTVKADKTDDTFEITFKQ